MTETTPTPLPVRDPTDLPLMIVGEMLVFIGAIYLIRGFTGSTDKDGSWVALIVFSFVFGFVGMAPVILRTVRTRRIQRATTPDTLPEGWS